MGFNGPSELQASMLKGMMVNEDGSREVRTSLKLAIARSIDENIELPCIANEWLQKYLRDELPELTPDRGPPTTQKYQHRISQVMAGIVEYIGLEPTRNDEPAPNNENNCKESAVDAVVDAMRELGASPSSYSRIKAIWLKHGKMKIHVKDLSKDYQQLKT